MTEAQKTRAAGVLERHGRMLSGDLGLDLSSDTPETLFRWLCGVLLVSARIATPLALKAARALADEGWTTPQRMADARWEDCVRVLNGSGYARYDESTARMLGDTSRLLIERYDGNLRELRRAAGRDPAKEHRLLQEFKGIGPVGADIFLREVQLAWDELYPFADDKALEAAQSIDLPDTAEGLARLVPRADFPRLLSGLIRADLAGDLDAIRLAAEEE